MSRLWSMLRRATVADAFVLLALAALISAFLYPTWRARAFRERVDSAIADVDQVGSAARRVLGALERWPSPGAPGEVPPELADLAGVDSPFARIDYAIGWQTWALVDSVQAPPEPLPPPTPGDAPRAPPGPRWVPVARTVGAVRVSSSDDGLLAELAQHYGTSSFVLDSVFVLVLPERAPAQAP